MSLGKTKPDSIPDRGVKYYTFFNPIEDATIIISLTAYDKGDPDLFVNYGKNNYPSKENSTWKSVGVGSDNVIIRP